MQGPRPKRASACHRRAFSAQARDWQVDECRLADECPDDGGLENEQLAKRPSGVPQTHARRIDDQRSGALPHGDRPIAAWLAGGRPMHAPPCGDQQNAALPNGRGSDEQHPSDRCSDALEPDDRSRSGLTTAAMPPASATTWSRDLRDSSFQADVPRDHDDAHCPTKNPIPSAIARNDRCRFAHRAIRLDAFGAGFRRESAALSRCDHRVDLPSPFLSSPLLKCETARLT